MIIPVREALDITDRTSTETVYGITSHTARAGWARPRHADAAPQRVRAGFAHPKHRLATMQFMLEFVVRPGLSGNTAVPAGLKPNLYAQTTP